MLSCAAAGVNDAEATAVERNAAAARDVIAIRFNMTCLLQAQPGMGSRLIRITQITPGAFRADRRNSRAHSALFSPCSGSGQQQNNPGHARQDPEQAERMQALVAEE